jgi:hypothetical protein
VVLLIEILKGKACTYRGQRTFHCWVSAGECSKGNGFLEVLNNMSVKIFEGAVTRAEYLFRLIH